VTRYTSATDQDRRDMLARIGVGEMEDLFEAIPGDLRLKEPLKLPDGMSEQDVFEHLSQFAARNRHADEEVTFLGAGMYDHYQPALIDTLISRSELTGLPVSNAALYEGPSSVASAGYLALQEFKGERRRFVTSRGVHPHSRETLETYSAGFGTEVVETPLTEAGATDLEQLAAAITDDTAAVFLQQPNFLGTVEDLGPLVEAAKRTGAVVVCAVDPMTLGILKPPGEYGVDIAVGEGQPLGNRLDYGGPSFGFFAAHERFIRKMPGRIAGETVDADGKRGFVLTLQTREQHIRREKATHNICTAQALNALAGVIYLSWLGKRGVVEIGELMLRRTAYARDALGLDLINPGPVVREFAVRVPNLDGVVRAAREQGINPGYRLARDYPEYEDGLLIAITERRTRADIDRLAAVVAGAREQVTA
jgi:glycine dehydrogenase subunit 1